MYDRNSDTAFYAPAYGLVEGRLGFTRIGKELKGVREEARGDPHHVYSTHRTVTGVAIGTVTAVRSHLIRRRTGRRSKGRVRPKVSLFSYVKAGFSASA